MRTLKNCPICLSADISLFYNYKDSSSKAWSIYRCRNCTHGFINPQPSWEELSSYYSDDYHPYECSYGALDCDDKIIAEARQSGEFRGVVIRPGMQILDLGCGGGYFMRIASRLGATVEGIEPSEIGAMRAQEAGFKVFKGTIAGYVNQTEKRFDLITANHVLEHTDDPINTLLNIHKILEKKGVLCVSMPNAGCWASRKLKAHWHATEIPRHLHQFTAQSIIKAGKASGWSIDKLITHSLPWGTAASIRLHLRYNYFLPRRITENIKLIDKIALSLSTKLDSQNGGESLIAYLSHPDFHYNKNGEKG